MYIIINWVPLVRIAIRQSQVASSNSAQHLNSLNKSKDSIKKMKLIAKEMQGIDAQLKNVPKKWQTWHYDTSSSSSFSSSHW